MVYVHVEVRSLEERYLAYISRYGLNIVYPKTYNYSIHTILGWVKIQYQVKQYYISLWLF